MSALNPVRRLSVAIIVRDAAESLRLTLASVRQIADEIVVVDTGSTDRTRSVALEFSARVFDFPWSDDFSAARNFAYSQIAGDWCLWLDAGETLSDADATSLREFVTTRAMANQAYLLLVRFPAADPSATVEQIARVRLVPRQAGIRFVGRVRESLTDSLTAEKIGLTGLPQIIRRSDRERDIRLKKQRAQRNRSLAELEMNPAGENARLWNCLGDAWQTLGEQEQAVRCFRQSLSVADRGSAAMLEAYYGLLSSVGAAPSQADESLRLCMQALEVFPVDTQLLCALGGYLQTRNHLPLASKSYLTAYRFGQVNPLVAHVADIREIAAVCHSITLQLLDQTEAAAEFLESALRDYSHSVRLRRRLIEVFIQKADRESALLHTGALPETTPHKEALRSAVRGACFAVQRNLIAAKAYLNAAYSHGCRDSICLKWLSLSLMSAGEWTNARPILEEWRTLESRNPEVEQLLVMLNQQPPATASGTRRFDAGNSALVGPAAPLRLNLPAARSNSAPPTTSSS